MKKFTLISDHKAGMQLHSLREILVGAVVVFALNATGAAQTLFWSANLGSPTPTGTWDTSTANWSVNSDGSSPQTWAGGSAATFSAGAGGTGTYTVTLSGTQAASGLTVKSGALTLSGGTLSLSSGSPINVADGSSLSIGSAFSAGSGFSFAGNTTGTMQLSGSGNAIGGNVAVNSGTLTIGGSGTYSAGTAFSIASGATLQLSSLYTNINSTVYTGTGTLNVNGGWLLGNNSILGSFQGAIKISGTNNYLSFTSNYAPNSAASVDVGSGAKLYLRETTSLSVGSKISGSGTLIRDNNSGTVTLTNANNSFTGALSISSGGKITVDAAGSIGTPALAFGTGGGTVTFNNGSQTLTSLSSSVTASAVALSNSTTLTLNEGSSTNDSYSGAITGGGSVIKTGAGSMNLKGTNSYTGGTTVNAGTLTVSTGASLGTGALTVNAGTLNLSNASQTVGALGGTGGTVNLGSGHTLTTNASTSSSFAGTLAGSGNFTKAGAGTLTLTGANTYTGTTTLAGGTVALGSSGALGGSGNLTFTGGALQYSAVNTQDYASRIANSTGAIFLDTNGQAVTLTGNLGSSNTGGLTKTGAGTLTLTGANTYTGTTTLAGGTVALGSSGALGGSGSITFTGGGLQYGANNANDYSSRMVNSTAAILLDTNGQAVTLADNLDSSNTGGLTKTGAGTLTLAGANAYTGTTTLAGGTVALGSSGALGGSGNITFTGGGLQYSANNTNDYASRIANSTGTILLDTNGQAVTLTGNLDSSNTGGLTKTGAGTLTLAGANAYTGTTTLASGTVALGSSGALGGSGNITFTGGGLKYSENNTNDYASRIANSTGAIILDTNGQAVRLAGNLGSGNTGGLTKTGAGTLTLAGTNTYGGTTTLAGGTMVLDSNGALGGSGNITFTGGGLQYGMNNANDYASRIANSTGAILLDTNGLAVTWAGNIDSSNTGGLTKTGAGTLTLAGANTYTGTTTLAGGILALGSSGALGGSGNITFTGGRLQFGANNTNDYASRIANSTDAIFLDTNGQTVTLAGNLDSSNTGGLRKTGAGTLVLTAANTYRGTTTLAGGTLTVDGNGQLGAGALAVNDGTLNLNGTVASTVAGLSGSGGVINLASTSGLGVQQSGDSVFSGSFTGAGGFTKDGTGSLSLNGVNDQTGTTVLSGGQVIVAAGAKLAADTSNVVFAGGTLTLNNDTQTLSAVSGNSGTLQLGSNHMLTLRGGTGGGIGAGTFNGTIAGAGGITIDAGGDTATWGGSSSNTRTGVTRINSGTLALAKTNGALAIGGGAVELSGGSMRLDGDQQIARTASLTLDGGTFNLNDRTQTFATALLVKGDSIIDFGASGLGALSFASSSSSFWSGTLTLVNFSASSHLSFGTDASGLNQAQLASLLTSGYSGRFMLDSHGNLALTAVPEPASYAAFIATAGLAAAFWHRRRRSPLGGQA
ncbi:MAG: autotransporter-associated beta strand repeat-containing protein [Verrucomicrobia bacterium]|nr:autotransporter-associated beta strand repeat-containing protein [Verrucomicrobiota bacterium]